MIKIDHRPRCCLPASQRPADLEKGEVKSLEHYMQAAFDPGRQMVLPAARKFEYPAGIGSAGHGYGTWIK